MTEISNLFSRMRIPLLPILLVVCLLVVVGVAEACPGCKDALAENDPDQARVVRGYFWSILFMMGMPFAIFGTIGTYLYLEVRRARAGPRER